MGDYEFHISTITQWVFDEKKTITYKYLSNQIGVSSNYAKQLLYDFAQRNRNKVESIIAISGLTQTDHLMRIHLVPEKKLSVIESKFSKILSKHVYSVSSTSLVDSAQLWSADREIPPVAGLQIPIDDWQNYHLSSAVHCTGIQRKARCTSKKAAAVSSVAPVQPKVEPKPVSIPNTSTTTTTTTNPSTTANNDQSSSNKKHEKPTTTKKDAPKSKGIMGMFGKATASKPADTITKETNSIEKPLEPKKDEEKVIEATSAPKTTSKKTIEPTTSDKLKDDKVEDKNHPKEMLVEHNNANQSKTTNNTAKEAETNNHQAMDVDDVPNADDLDDELLADLENDNSPKKRRGFSKLKKTASQMEQVSDDDIELSGEEPVVEKPKAAAKAKRSNAKKAASPKKKSPKKTGSKKSKAETVEAEDAMEVEETEKTEKTEVTKEPKKRKKRERTEEQEEPEPVITEQRKRFDAYFGATSSNVSHNSVPETAADIKVPRTRTKVVSEFETYVNDRGYTVTKEVEKTVEEEIPEDEWQQMQKEAVEKFERAKALEEAKKASKKTTAKAPAKGGTISSFFAPVKK